MAWTSPPTLHTATSWSPMRNTATRSGGISEAFATVCQVVISSARRVDRFPNGRFDRGTLEFAESRLEEALDDQLLGRRAVQAATLQVENHLLVDRPDRRAVGAADHVVVQDLQLGVRVGFGSIREQDVLLLLAGLGLARRLVDADEPGEVGARAVAQRVVDHQVAARGVARVVLQRLEIGVLSIAKTDHAEQV